MAEIEFSRVLAGAVPFKDDNINDTFRGQVLLVVTTEATR